MFPFPALQHSLSVDDQYCYGLPDFRKIFHACTCLAETVILPTP